MLTLLRQAGWPAYAAAVAVLSATLTIAKARRHRAARARVREALAVAPTPPDAWSDGADVTLRGVLRAERPVTALALISFASGREQIELATSAVDDGWLEVGDIRVALAGSVAIAVGSHVLRHHELPPDRFEAASVARAKVRRATELHLWRGGIDGYHARRISPGDEVLARGRLVRDPDSDTWRLAPIRDAIELAAIGGVVDP